jgi:hypothetical protein
VKLAAPAQLRGHDGSRFRTGDLVHCRSHSLPPPTPVTSPSPHHRRQTELRARQSLRTQKSRPPVGKRLLDTGTVGESFLRR